MAERRCPFGRQYRSAWPRSPKLRARSAAHPASLASHLFAAALTVVVFTTARATTLQHVDTRELTIGSSDIVIGVVEGTRSYWNPSRTRIFTDVTVRVDQSLKGAPAERLTLTQLGGEVDGARYTIPGCPSFRVGEEALLFVWRDRQGRAQVNGLAQGKFDIRRDPATGERFVQRLAPGFAVRDLRTLKTIADGAPVGAGIYFARMKAEGRILRARVVWLR